MQPPVDLADLPSALAKQVRAAQKDTRWGVAIDAFEDWLEEATSRPPHVLLMLAFMVYRDALEVMVDEVEERGTRALALIDEANLPKQAAKLRAEIERSVSRDRAHTKAATKRAAKSRTQPLESLSRSDLRELAYKLGGSKDLDDLATSARAWLLAAAHETDDYEKNDCLARAALAFAGAKQWDEAVPRLEAIVKQPGEYDGWIPDYAWYQLLDKAIAEGDLATFKKRWKGALAMKREDPFPYSHPSQDAYLAFAVDNKLADIAKHVAAVVMEHRKPRERKALQNLLDRAAKL